MSGIMLSDPATEAFPSITYDTQIAPPSVNMALLVGAWSPDAFTFELAGGQVHVERDVRRGSHPGFPMRRRAVVVTICRSRWACMASLI